MICYKDQTFCFSDCVNTKCFRYISEDVISKSVKLDLPLAQSDFSGDCNEYISEITPDSIQ